MIDWTETDIVFIRRPPKPQCPRCGSERRIITKSMALEGDGSRTQRSICERCSSRFRVVVERAESEPANDWQT
ncbi:hypothetical protein [Botrimarina sp.]|uniref:hypothetical protein n=1 Tax=Botrimarina sp. TaxID=2795802 RepID=UPI0032F001AC